MSDVTFHLVCGSTGAGKTTHALGLVRETGAMHFSIDDWMVTLYGPDAPQPPHWPWIVERVARCGRQIVGTALELGKRGVSSVLDLGFQREDQRRAVAEAARTAGLGVRLHFLDVPADERWRRVSGRNDRQGETYRVTVTRPMFDFIETIWQPPGPAEMAAMEGVRVG
jgi:predicted kinase